MNPFSYSTVVKGNSFFDRKEECARLVSTLSGGNNMVMLAPRRFGKTSLVFRVIEQLERKGFLCIYCAVINYANMHNAKMHNVNSF
jgi:AAA+ ATPase superfamily predicted ATPase